MPAIPSSGASLPVADTTSIVVNGSAYGKLDAGLIASGQIRKIAYSDRDFYLSDFQCHPLHRPASANSLDDEFDGSSLNAKWSWLNQGSATAAVMDGCLKLTSAVGTNGTTHNLHGLIQSASLTSGSWKCFAKVGIRTDATEFFNSVDFIRAGLIMQDSSSGRVEGLFVTHNSSVNGSAPNLGVMAVKYNSATSLNSAYATRAIVHGKSLYLILLKSGSTIYAGYSLDGDEPIVLTTWTQTGFLATPDRVGLACDALNASSKKCILLSPFFRFESL